MLAAGLINYIEFQESFLLKYPEAHVFVVLGSIQENWGSLGGATVSCLAAADV